MGIIEALKASPLAADIGWTILHFLWQGALLGLLTATTLAVLRGRSPGARYAVAVCSMGLMLLAPIVTLALMIALRPDAPADEVAMTTAIAPAAPTIASRLAPVMPWLTLAWLAGALVFQLRFLVQVAAVRRLRTRGTSPLPAAWRGRVNDLHRSLGMGRHTTVLQSSLAAVPMVVGWIRPVVLVPTCALTGLSTAQLQAIIAHELGHVRRHDHLINLVQAFFECLLFFHPAVWWLSERLRIEREYCCDDIAVTTCGSVRTYAEALSSLDIIGADRAVLASNGGSLMNRIARLAGTTAGPNATRRKRHGGWVSPLLILALVTVAGSAAALTPAADDDERKAEIKELMQIVEHLAQQLHQVAARAAALHGHDDEQHARDDHDDQREREWLAQQEHDRRLHPEHAQEIHEHAMQLLHDRHAEALDRAHVEYAERLHAGDEEGARHAYERALREIEVAHEEHSADAYVRAQRAYEQGELELAHAHALRALAMAEGDPAAAHRRFGEAEAQLHALQARSADIQAELVLQEMDLERLHATDAPREAIHEHMSMLERLHRELAGSTDEMADAQAQTQMLHDLLAGAQAESEHAHEGDPEVTWHAAVRELVHQAQGDADPFADDADERARDLHEAMRHIEMRERQLQREANGAAEQLEAELEVLHAELDGQRRIADLEMRRAMTELEEHEHLMKLEQHQRRARIEAELRTHMQDMEAHAKEKMSSAERELAHLSDDHPRRAAAERELASMMEQLNREQHRAQERAQERAEVEMMALEMELEKSAVQLDSARKRYELDVMQRETELEHAAQQAMREHDRTRARYERELALAREALHDEALQLREMAIVRTEERARATNRRHARDDDEARAAADAFESVRNWEWNVRKHDSVDARLDALRRLLEDVHAELQRLLEEDDG